MEGQNEPSPVASAHEGVRQARQAGREAIRRAREHARETARQAREHAGETARQARETRREAARQVQATARAAREAARAARAGSSGPAEADTRTRIQQIALELFTEYGYEATSLREIAERLGVTKAALYYHFKTKDDIVGSLVEDRVAKIDELIAWVETEPRTVETRRDFIRRYAQLLHEGGHHNLMRFFERNQTVMHSHKSGAFMRERMIKMQDILSDRDASLADQLRCSLAIFALHSTWFVLRDPDVTDEQRRATALDVALDLIS